MPTVLANGLDIHYRITGDGPETVLLINGVGDDLEGWAMQVEPACRRRSARHHVRQPRRRALHRFRRARTPVVRWQRIRGHSRCARSAAVPPCRRVDGRADRAGICAGRTPTICSRSCSPTRTPGPTPTHARPSRRGHRSPQSGGMALMMRQQAPWVFSPAFYNSHPEQLAAILAEMERSPQPAWSFAAQIAALLTHDCADAARLVADPGARDRGGRRHHHPAVALAPHVRRPPSRILGDRARGPCRFSRESRPVESGRH